MAEGNRGERTIGSGHLVALFLGIVVVCCVFFILGYEMGRTQFERGAAPASASKGASPAPAKGKDEPLPPGWSTATPAASNSPGKSGATPAASASGAAQPAGHASAPAASPAKAAGAKPSSPSASQKAKSGGGLDAYQPPQIPRGAVVLQVAANRNETDALNLAKILQEKGFPAFVLTPSTDDWYRVQVGPFADAKTADEAKSALAREGFKAIVKR
jgi:cell division septation protein DedD